MDLEAIDIGHTHQLFHKSVYTLNFEATTKGKQKSSIHFITLEIHQFYQLRNMHP